jgi:hypothetical protein
MRRTTPRKNGGTKFKGKFDYGWDQAAGADLPEAAEMGVIPAGYETHPPSGRNSRLGQPL